MSSSILVTGANGLLARALVKTLAGAHEVHATAHVPTDTPVAGVQYHHLDFAADDWLTRLPAKVDVIVHLAQSSKYRQFPEMAPDIFAVNTASTARLLDYAQRGGTKQFIYFSTGGLYRPGSTEVDESSALLPLDALNYHFASKLSGETLVNCYAKLMQTVVVRPFFIWGKGQRRSMFIPRLADQIAKGESIFLDGPEGIRVNPIHVDDAAAFVAQLIARSQSGLFNMAGPEALSIKDIADTIGRHLGVTPAYSRREAVPQDLFASIRKMSESHRPAIRVADRIQDVIA